MKTLGEANAIVEELVPVTDGAPAVAIALRFEDGRVERTNLRADLVPAGLSVGDRVGVTRAALYQRWTLRRLEE